MQARKARDFGRSRDSQRRKHQALAQKESQPLAGPMEVKVPRRSGQAERVSLLEIRFQEVTVLAPLLKEGQPALKLRAVEAREPLPVKAQPPILWRLLTTLPVHTVEQARERVYWYAQRWQIEVFHKVLKSGCQIEQRQLETLARLKRVLRLDLIVAGRVMFLSKAARAIPEDSAGHWLLESEWKVLWCYMNPGQRPPSHAPGL